MLSNRIYETLQLFTKNRIQKAVIGAAIGAMAAIIFYLILYTASHIRTGLNKFLNVLLLAGLAFSVILLVFLLVIIAFKILRRINPISFALIGIALFLSKLLPYTSLSLPFVLLQALLGFMVGLTFASDTRKIWRVIAIAVAAIINISIFCFLLSPGRNEAVPISKSYWEQEIHPVQMSNPMQAGLYPVKELFYGSGNDKHRPEYREKISIKTNPVDATAFFDQSKGVKNALRKSYWGFNSKNYPLNARVWYPDAEGAFPLVLIVHGNDLMAQYSDAGFGYLGRLLASRGYIVASIDENFLNFAWFDDYYFSELFIRGWLILKHLENWRTWNEKAGSVFYKKIDMENISLIGHSRGGDAASIAALLNKMNRYTLDATQTFNFNFSIKGIVQIAPTDFYSLQSDVPVKLDNINYLLLHGGHDQDIYWQMGIRAYNRINFTDTGYHFKASLYIYRANHGQFTTRRGRMDHIPPTSFFLNTKPIMPKEEQERIAQLYVSAFLEATLKNKKEYIPLFEDYRNGHSLLPKDYYINVFADSRFRYLAKFDEDVKVTSASAPGCTIEANNLKKWKEDAIPLRRENGSTQNNVGVFLGWDKKNIPNVADYTIRIPDSAIKSLKIDSTRYLTFDVCNNTDDINDVDFSIELITKSGILKTTLKRHIHLPPLLQTKLTKPNPLYRIKSQSDIERVMQSVQIPFSEFIPPEKSFNPSDIRSVRFIFDKTPVGEIILDNIGFY